MADTYRWYRADTTEWLTSNMRRNYPFADSVNVSDIVGHTLPASFLVDLRLAIPIASDNSISEFIDDVGRFYISQILYAGGRISVYISYMPVQGNPFVCACVTNIPGNLEPGTIYTDYSDNNQTGHIFAITPQLSHIPEQYSYLSGLSGILVIGTCVDIHRTYELSYSGARIAPMCISGYPLGISSVSVIDSSGVSTRLTSDFTLVAGDGIELTVNESDNGTELMITRKPTLSESTSGNLDIRSVDEAIEAIYARLGTPVKSINGVLPDSSGNVTLRGRDCVNIQDNEGAVIISNSCAKPCCSNTNPSDVASALAALTEAKDRLMQYYTSMANNINQLQSRLGSLIISDSRK